jgi:hypothetical protein
MFWRALPKTGMVPNRSAFLPERAPQFLRDLVLCESLPQGRRAFPFRLLGTGFEARLMGDIKGEDYLQFLPEAYHDKTINTAREIVRRPCGLWQVMPIHYERGFAQNIEITIFPLGPGPDNVDLLLVFTQSAKGLVMPAPTGNKVMATDTAVVHQYIDLGAGIPE